MRRDWRLVGLAWMLLVLHVGCVQVQRNTAPPEKPVRTPKPFLADGAPKLEPTEDADWRAAPSLDDTLYYYAPRREWYRFYYSRWFQAFSWDGAWFELPDAEVPAFLKPRGELKPETKKTVRDRLKELDEKLKEIERQEREAEESEDEETESP